MFTAQETVTLEIEEWEIEVDLLLEFTVDPGDKGDYWTPGYAPYVEEIFFNDAEATQAIENAIVELEKEENIELEYDMSQALEVLETTIDSDHILSERLLESASDDNRAAMEYHYESKRDI